MGPERELIELASRQYYVFTHRQAVGVGFSPRTISRWVETGRWKVLHRGVYVGSGVTVGWQQRVMGACLACGPGAACSHSSAEVVWEFGSVLDAPHVTVPITSRKRHPDIEIHRSRSLDAVGHRGFRVTHPMRTLLDLVPKREEETIERYLDNAHRRGLIAVRRFDRYLAEPRNAKRPGSALLRRLLAARDPDRPIDSDLETIFFRAVRGTGLPPPLPQHPVETLHGMRYIDFAYPDQHLAIEVDGYADRANREAFEYDRARQNDIEELGWAFRRFTWRMLRSDPTGVAITVGRALGLRPVRWKPGR